MRKASEKVSLSKAEDVSTYGGTRIALASERRGICQRAETEERVT
jgi:hypothetical protein